MVHMPAAIVQHHGNHAIPVATVFTRQRDDIRGQTLLVWQTARYLALCRSVLTRRAAGPAVRDAQHLTHVLNAPAAT